MTSICTRQHTRTYAERMREQALSAARAEEGHTINDPRPRLVLLLEDPQLSGSKRFLLQPGDTLVGRSPLAHIRFFLPCIAEQHAYLSRPFSFSIFILILAHSALLVLFSFFDNPVYSHPLHAHSYTTQQYRHGAQQEAVVRLTYFRHRGDIPFLCCNELSSWCPVALQVSHVGVLLSPPF